MLIREAIKIFDAQPDWESDYVGYLKNERLWEVIVIDKNGWDIGSLFFERMQTVEDFDTVVPNENYDWLGEHEGWWWRACEFLEDALYKRDLETEIERLAQPFWEEREYKSCPIDAIGPEAKALITAINALLLPVKKGNPQMYDAYWDVQDGNRQSLRIGFFPPDVLLGHIHPGYSDRNLMLDGISYYLGGEWNQLLKSPGRYQALAEKLQSLIEEKAYANCDTQKVTLLQRVKLPTNIPASDAACS